MTVIPMIGATAEPAELQEVFEQLRRTRGRVPGMYRTLAHQPAILAAHRAYFHAALDTGALPRAFKEMLAYKVARLHNSAYCTGSHRTYAITHGVSQERLTAIDNSDYRGFDAGEAAAFELAESMIGSDKEAARGIMEKLRERFAAKEIVEIVALIGIMELACTLAGVFALEPDGE